MLIDTLSGSSCKKEKAKYRWPYVYLILFRVIAWPRNFATGVWPDNYAFLPLSFNDHAED